MEKRINDFNLITKYVNRFFDNRDFIYCQINNYSKLSNFICKKNIVIDEELSEMLLEECDKINSMFKFFSSSNVLVRLLDFNNLNSLLDMYCFKNNIILSRDVEISTCEKDGSINLLKLYMNEIGSYSLLNKDEERVLLNRMSHGDEKARLELIERNLRLVIPIARSYVGNGISFTDLIQYGNEGLIKASLKFDSSKNNRFSTYAVWWIRQSIDRAVSNYGSVIRIPVSLYEDRFKINKAIREYGVTHEENVPTDLELVKLTGLSLEKIKNVKFSFNGFVSLSSPVLGSEDITLEDVLEDDKSLMDMDSNDENSKESFINEIIRKANLSEREIYIVKCRNGFFGKIYSLDEIGSELGVSRERIRQIEKKTLQKLSSASKENNKEVSSLSYSLCR